MKFLPPCWKSCCPTKTRTGLGRAAGAVETLPVARQTKASPARSTPAFLPVLNVIFGLL
jgi:hypothetical protein